MEYRERKIMGRLGLMGSLGLAGLMALLGLWGCSDDSGETESRGRVTLEARLCSTTFEENEADDMSRAGLTGQEGFLTRSGETWTPPTPYVTYDRLNGRFYNQKDLVNKSIDAFFTQDGQTPLEGTFFYKEADQSWYLNMDLEETTNYLYGFIPKEDASSATIVSYNGSEADGNNSYSNGAVLTINELNTVTPSDVCVIIGAQNGTAIDNDANDDGRLRAGHFAVTTKATSKDNPAQPGSNYIFLLFDHLYSSLRFRFSVDEGYASLRTIKLRRLELTATDKSGNGIKAKYNATITLKSNNTGSSPIVDKVIFTPVATSADVPYVPLFDGETELKVVKTAADSPEYLGCFVPGDNYYFKLRCTYDVYDKNVTSEHPEGNLIRQGCQAENTIDLTDNKFGGEDLKVMRGHCYSFKIKVQPTYLYVLSEPDLDNPTMSFGN